MQRYGKFSHSDKESRARTDRGTGNKLGHITRKEMSKQCATSRTSLEEDTEERWKEGEGKNDARLSQNGGNTATQKGKRRSRRGDERHSQAKEDLKLCRFLSKHHRDLSR